MKVLVFGAARDIIEKGELNIELTEPKSIQSFRADLMHEFPALKNLNALAIAVNEVYANDDVVVNNQDVVALIPPVSGG